MEAIHLVILIKNLSNLDQNFERNFAKTLKKKIEEIQDKKGKVNLLGLGAIGGVGNLGQNLGNIGGVGGFGQKQIPEEEFFEYFEKLIASIEIIN